MGEVGVTSGRDNVLVGVINEAMGEVGERRGRGELLVGLSSDVRGGKMKGAEVSSGIASAGGAGEDNTGMGGNCGRSAPGSTGSGGSGGSTGRNGSIGTVGGTGADAADAGRTRVWEEAGMCGSAEGGRNVVVVDVGVGNVGFCTVRHDGDVMGLCTSELLGSGPIDMAEVGDDGITGIESRRGTLPTSGLTIGGVPKCPALAPT
jgi:hypothetical protein